MVNNSGSSNCFLVFNLQDSYGDGWSGALLTVSVNGVPNTLYTLNFLNPDSLIDTLHFNSGDHITLSFLSGFYPSEESYSIYDSDGNLLFQDGPFPLNGINVWTYDVFCGAHLDYTWNPSATINPNNSDSVWASPTANTTYSVIGMDPIGGCVDTATITVHVVTNFNIDLTQSDDSICLNDQVQFNVNADVVLDYSYSWTPSNMMNDDTIFNPIGTFTNSGLIPVLVSVSSSEGCTKYDSVHVLVSSNTVPEITVIGDSTLCSGDSALLVAQNSYGSNCFVVLNMHDSYGDGSNGAALKLYVNGVLDSTYTIPNTISLYDTLLVDTIYLNSGDLVSINYTDGNYPSEESYDVYDGSGNLLFSDGPSPVNGDVWSYTMNCSAPLSYIWSPTSSLSSSNTVSTWASPNTSVTYTVIALDPIGECSDTASFNIYVVPTFNIEASVSDDSICLNDQVQFQVSADSSFSFTYDWTPSNIMSNASIPNPTGIFDAPGLQAVYVEVSSALGCNKLDSVQVLVSQNAKPAMVIMGDSLICIGDSTLLLAVDTANKPCFIVLDLRDSDGDGWNGAILALNINGTLDSIYTIQNTLSGNDTILVDTVYLMAGDLVSIDFASGSFPFEESYTIYDADGNVLFSDGPNPLDGNNVWNYTMYCGGPLNYVWSPVNTLSTPFMNPTWANPSVPANYTVIATDPIGGCADTANYHVHVLPLPIVNITTTDLNYCLNEGNVTFAATPGPGYWNGTVIDSASGSFSPANSGLGSHEITYHHFNGGCWGSDTFEVVVNPFPAPPVATSSSPYCARYRITDLSATGSGGEIKWYTNAALTSQVNPVGLIANNYSVYVTETNSFGCASFPTVLPITVTYTPNLAFVSDYDSVNGEAPVTINFENNSVPQGAAYSWFINGSPAGNTYDLTKEFTEGDIYTIMLIGVNPTAGCRDTAYMTLDLYQLAIEIPNVFTPNNDLLNETFYAKAKGLKNFNITIYNRWGKIVYGPCGPTNKPADCTWNGGDNPDGTYFYTITADDRNGKPIQRDDFQGHITLIRK